MNLRHVVYSIFLMAVSTAQAAGVDPTQLAIIGGTSPNPATSEGYFTVRNRLDRDILCDLRVTGVISGRDPSGLILTATQDSQPLTGMRLGAQRERELRFNFEPAVVAMRRQWNDPNAKLTSVDRAFSYFNCTVVEAPAGGNTSPAIAFDKPYLIVNGHSGKCLNLEVKRLGVDGYRDGGTVFQYGCPFGPTPWTNNHWMFSPVESASGTRPLTVMIKSAYSLKCLDLFTNNGGSADGERVQQFDCFAGRTSEINRNWMLVPADNGSYYIKSAWSNKCLDVSSSDPSRDGFADGGRVHQWECGSRPYRANQLWRLIPAG